MGEHAASRNVAAGPDGNVWFTENRGNKIGRIAGDGVVTEYLVPTPGSGPSGITAGPDGKLWFTEFYGDKIGVDREALYGLPIDQYLERMDRAGIDIAFFIAAKSGSLGARCVAMLLDAISRGEDPAAPEASISPVVEPQLIIRDSVASI